MTWHVTGGYHVSQYIKSVQMSYTLLLLHYFAGVRVIKQKVILELISIL